MCPYAIEEDIITRPKHGAKHGATLVQQLRWVASGMFLKTSATQVLFAKRSIVSQDTSLCHREVVLHKLICSVRMIAYCYWTMLGFQHLDPIEVVHCNAVWFPLPIQ